MRSRLLSAVIGLLIANSLATAEEPTAKLKKVIPTDSVQFARAFSPDLQVATLIFDNLVAATEIGKGSLPSVHSRVFSFVLQVEGTSDVNVIQAYRGFAQSTGTGSTSLVIHAGGKTTVVDLRKSTRPAEYVGSKASAEVHEQAVRAGRELGFTKIEHTEAGTDYLQIVETRLPAGKPLQVTLFLITDRLTGDDGSGALLTVDTIDFELKSVPAAKPK